MKKFAKIALIVLMLAVCILAVTACNDDKLVISISDDNMPQTVFVKGNDLDLSAGKLTAKKGKEINEIELNSQDVTVSGYDKDTLGEQTLTISYGGASTTLKINVVERMIIKSYTEDFVIGEPFDSIGQVIVTQDNGSSETLYFHDDRLSFKFNTSTVGAKQVEVTYDSNGKVFGGVYPITVYSADTITPVYPSKTDYQSHETALDFSDGSFYVTFKNNTKNTTVPMSANMFAGFNPASLYSTSLTTETDIPEVADKKQTVTVNYPDGQHSFNFVIDVSFSNVSRIKNISNKLSTLDWTGNAPCAVSDADGELAVYAMKLFLGLTDEEKFYLPREERLVSARPAVVYANAKFVAEAEKYTKMFTISNNNLSIECETYDIAKDGIAELKALPENNDMFVYGDILQGTAQALGNGELYADMSISKYLGNVCSGEEVKDSIKKIDLLIQMYDALDGVTLENMNDADSIAKIEAAYGKFMELGEISVALIDRYVFNLLSEWRTAAFSDDYYTILYKYYYSLWESGIEDNKMKAMTCIDSMFNLCLPGELETFFLTYLSTIIAQSDLEYYDEVSQPAADIDTISFIKFYRELVKVEESIYKHNDDMIVFLYENYFNNSDTQLVTDLLTSSFGVFELMGAAYGISEFDAMWNSYIDIINDFAKLPDGATFVTMETEIKALFEAYVNLTPELQTQFLESLNPYGSPEFIITIDKSGRMTLFSFLIYGYYQEAYPTLFGNETENGIILELLGAIEYYALRDQGGSKPEESFLVEFVKTMKNVESMYGKLGADDKTSFDDAIGFAYTRYLNIAELYDEQGAYIKKEFPTGEGEDAKNWDDEVKAFQNMISFLGECYAYAYFSYAIYPVYISTFQTVQDTFNYFMTDPSVPPEVKEYVLYSTINVSGGGELSIETLMYQYRAYYMQFLAQYPIDDEYAFMPWNHYMSEEGKPLRDYMTSLFNIYFLYMYQNNNIDIKIDIDMVKTAIEGFLALTEENKVMFVSMDGGGEYVFFNALRSFFAEDLKENETLLNIVNELLDLTAGWCGNNLTKDNFVKAWETFQDKYSATLNADTLAALEGKLPGLYDYLKGQYDTEKAALNPPETNPDDSQQTGGDSQQTGDNGQQPDAE